MGADPLERESPADRRARIFVRQRRRRRWLSLVILLVLILASGSGLLAAYRWIARTPETSDVPLIRADDQPTRKRPSDPGGMAVPDQDSLVLNRIEPKTERLLPPPESPLPRPAPAPAPAAPASNEAPAATTPPAAAAPTPPPPPSTVPAVPPKEVAAVPEAAPSAPPPKPKPAAVRPSAPVAPAVAPAGKGYRLQLGSVRTPNEAKAEGERLRQQNQDVLGTLGLTTERADLGSRGIYYRIQVGPLADAGSAERVCNELKRRGVGCILVKP